MSFSGLLNMRESNWLLYIPNSKQISNTSVNVDEGKIIQASRLADWHETKLRSARAECLYH